MPTIRTFTSNLDTEALLFTHLHSFERRLYPSPFLYSGSLHCSVTSNVELNERPSVLSPYIKIFSVYSRIIYLHFNLFRLKFNVKRRLPTPEYKRLLEYTLSIYSLSLSF